MNSAQQRNLSTAFDVALAAEAMRDELVTGNHVQPKTRSLVSAIDNRRATVLMLNTLVRLTWNDPDRLLRALGLTADRLLDHDRVADEDTDA